MSTRSNDSRMAPPVHPFIDAFISFWDAPAPDRLHELLHPDAVLMQPLSPRLDGIDAITRDFARILRFLPDLHTVVDRWNAHGDHVTIEFRLRATIGSDVVEWAAVDLFLLRGEKAISRVTHFDPIPLLAVVAGHPSVWRRWWASKAARPWRIGGRGPSTAS